MITKIHIPNLRKYIPPMRFCELAIDGIGLTSTNHKALISNHLVSIMHLIEQIRANFLLTGKDARVKYLELLFEEPAGEAATELFERNALNNLVLSINSMFEYLLILYFMSVLTVPQLTSVIEKEKVLEKSKNSLASEDNWQLALFSLIYNEFVTKYLNTQKKQTYEDWFKTSKKTQHLPPSAVNFNVLESFLLEQEKYLNTTHVNKLKHYGTNIYKMNQDTDPVVHGFWNFSVDEFYTNTHSTSTIGDRFDLLDEKLVIETCRQTFAIQCDFLNDILAKFTSKI